MPSCHSCVIYLKPKMNERRGIKCSESVKNERKLLKTSGLEYSTFQEDLKALENLSVPSDIEIMIKKTCHQNLFDVNLVEKDCKDLQNFVDTFINTSNLQIFQAL